MTAEPISILRKWFHGQGWQPLPFQERVWSLAQNGESGLILVATGRGKTYAAVGGFLLRQLALTNARRKKNQSGIKLLYISPLRSLAHDIRHSMEKIVSGLDLSLEVDVRNGDTTFARKKRQKLRPPDILITTPESLSLLLSWPGCREYFSSLEQVIVDEWHELADNKRGVLLQLSLSFLRDVAKQQARELSLWGMSATVGNPEMAAKIFAADLSLHLVEDPVQRNVRIQTLLPEAGRLPWGGHMGLLQSPQVAEILSTDVSTLIFTNTRFQAEKWFDVLKGLRPDLESRGAIHHSSLDGQTRQAVEDGLKSGALSYVVATSGLELGVDFPEVDQIVQVGSPKGVARLKQRAGRMGHTPTQMQSTIHCVPTQMMELIELKALRSALAEGVVEDRNPLGAPIDVLMQHLVTIACGDGFSLEEIERQLKLTNAFGDFSSEKLAEVLDYLVSGGKTLQAYPQFRKLILYKGRYHVTTPVISRFHRLQIGTIPSSAQIQVQTQQGKKIGLVEETFGAQLKPGDHFYFSGQLWQMVRLKEMKLVVKKSVKSSASVIPSWAGYQMPISEGLSRFLRKNLRDTDFLGDDEKSFVSEFLKVQDSASRVPRDNELLFEVFESKEGISLFCYPFAGISVNQALAALWAFQFGQLKTGSFSLSQNDYGFEILAPKGYPFREIFEARFLSFENSRGLMDQCLNLPELAKREFREIAQIAGLVFNGFPQAMKAVRHLQMSSSLFYDTFSRYEPKHPLLQQARDQVRRKILQVDRLERTLELMARAEQHWVVLEKPSPLSFPLMIERFRQNISLESLIEKVERMRVQWGL